LYILEDTQKGTLFAHNIIDGIATVNKTPICEAVLTQRYAPMSIFGFSKPEKEAIIQKLRRYFSEEMNQEIGHFEAGFLLDFISEEIGPSFYNKGIHDSEAILKKRIDDIVEAIDSLEKPIPTRDKNRHQ
jgi:uncharacterized protein (DUF2164 family)